MGSKSIRLGSTLTFDDKTEKDLIEVAEKLNGSHKMAEFMSNVFRLAVENPELLVKKGDKIGYGKLMKTMTSVGVSPVRMKYIERINSEIKRMADSVNSIYEMCQKMYVMAQVGKRLGLEEKTSNTLAAAFIAEKNAKDLSAIMGCDIGEFSSEKMKNFEEESEGLVEYILETYDGMLKEFIKVEKVDTSIEHVSKKEEPKKEDTSTYVESKNETGSSVGSGIEIADSFSVQNTFESVEDEEESTPVQFGAEGLGDLMKFLE